MSNPDPKSLSLSVLICNTIFATQDKDMLYRKDCMAEIDRRFPNPDVSLDAVKGKDSAIPKLPNFWERLNSSLDAIELVTTNLMGQNGMKTIYDQIQYIRLSLKIDAPKESAPDEQPPAEIEVDFERTWLKLGELEAALRNNPEGTNKYYMDIVQDTRSMFQNPAIIKAKS